MTFLLFTNRPEFSKFSAKQMEKFPNWKKLILTNNKDVTKCSSYSNTDIIYMDVENNTEMFNNWRSKNLSYDDDIFISDDDVWYAPWVEHYIDKNLEYYDRVCLTTCGMYSIKNKKFNIRNWDKFAIGTGIGISKYLWKYHKWKRHPDGMVYYFKHLPKHDTRGCCSVGLIHIIHGSNMILTENMIEKPEVLKDAINIPTSFIEDLKYIPHSLT